MTKKPSMNQVVYMNRGPLLEEIRALLHAPMPHRERAFYRALYESIFRPNELLQCNIEDFNRETGEIIARYPKKKYNPKTKKTILEPNKHMFLSDTSIALFRKVIGNRKKGAIFINDKGERISLRYLQKYIHNLSMELGIQKVTHITNTGKKYHLITLKSLREAGERHHDERGGDSDLSARAAQHSRLVKDKHYKKAGAEEIRESFRKHHPGFTGEI